MTDPASHALRRRAEWAPHAACWLAWPSHPREWGAALTGARRAVAELCAAIADVDPETGRARGETTELLVLDERGEAEARAALGGTPARFRHIRFGDVWLRDTGPLFVAGDGGTAAISFAFNGWGGRYLFEGDPELAGRIARAAGAPIRRFPHVIEGGAVETDGDGTCLATRQCLLNENRNPNASARDLERALAGALAIEHVIWLERGLANDHTDGHVDTLARFVGPGRVACMEPAGADDPNRDVLLAIARELSAARDARGRRLEVIRVPSPGRVVDDRGELLPASYLNFYIANRTVCVPVFGSPNDERAVAAIGALFPKRRVLAIDCRALVTGGGALHCITQEQPRAEAVT